MNVQDVIVEAFGALLRDGRAILQKFGYNGQMYDHGHPPVDKYLQYRTEALNLVRRACGEDSDHYRQLGRLADSTDSATNA